MASAGTEPGGPPGRQERPPTSEARLPPPTLSPESSTDSSEQHLSSRGSIRRKLSKQKEVVEEPEPLLNSIPTTTYAAAAVPVVCESPTAEEHASFDKEDSPSSMNPRSRQLVRGLALCGDDDTRLRPPPQPLQRHPNSLSRESSGTEYTDSSGIDLRAFVVATLHKNPRDRQMAMWLEQQLTSFVNDSRAQSYKFPQMSSYNRMLIHRIAALFGLDHNVDNTGKAVVVNKTDRTGRPEFDFSSLVQGSNFTDMNRKSYRSGQSFEEVRDPSLMGYGYSGGSVDNWWAMKRRTHSFETASMTGNEQPWSLRGTSTHSFEAAPNHQQHYTDRSAMLRKAGSFGGVPAYYRSGSALEGSDRPMNPHWRDYSPNGSVNSPINVADITDGVAAMQMQENQRAAPSQVMPHVATPPREYMYNVNNYGYQPTMYVQSTGMNPQFGPPYVVSTTVHHVTVAAHPNQVPYVNQPQAYVSPSYGYSDCDPSMMLPGSPYSGYMQGSPVPQHYYNQQYYELPSTAHALAVPEQQMPQGSTVPPTAAPTVNEAGPTPGGAPPTNNHRPLHSLDGGYGSLTAQDSLREENDCAE